ncbi:MAG: hypothetical protein CLLPBCKN_003399 [Chroococcidiopsis cubana SAG 39.79]|uniref:Uncharacterized protein n=1 Tax=Chroococcidiopsis cubana SAG 39.79 TaxID=388085 RepID=A0AB37UI45_9CYAN|nr:hypothetical protein [Chroococcidiopsis cubana]MDZ4874003.1 hypothetical protein [Chroococcidiopsis cubana SAG 39.79]PSB61958.1 hypothetical protein C7B79_19970 [Chroococcidiopsis cubana CCALA 043]RUT11040.1 hypothetical protein DSM107010_36740 [Chroococcidiopsis cubana SAG 39.79]
MSNRWEVGSEFDWSQEMLTQSPSPNLIPQPAELFSTGTAILLAFAQFLPQEPTRRLRLHLPCFFCMKVAVKLNLVFELYWYRDLPTYNSPDFSTLNPLPGDFVLAVNFFGVRDGQVWQDWSAQHQDIILIEDHSHDPFSLWARQSTAQYAMASLRKTLPIPDGAIIWSPQKLKLPKPVRANSVGAYKRLTAMLLKRAYLDGTNISKKIYRCLDLESQVELDEEENCAASEFTANILSCLNIVRFRQQREANVRQILNETAPSESSNWFPLFTSWVSGFVPFNFILVCKNYEIRDSLRMYLISHNIFPAIHWQQSELEISSQDILAIELSNKILTIPTDQRYTARDIARIGEILLNFNSDFENLSSEAIEHIHK